MNKSNTVLAQTAIAAFVVFALLALMAGVTGVWFVLLALGLAGVLGCVVSSSWGASAKSRLNLGNDRSAEFEAQGPKVVDG